MCARPAPRPIPVPRRAVSTARRGVTSPPGPLGPRLRTAKEIPVRSIEPVRPVNTRLSMLASLAVVVSSFAAVCSVLLG